VIIDAYKISVDWSNALLSVSKPLGKTNQTAVFNPTSSGFTASGNTITLPGGADPANSIDSAIGVGDVLKISGTDYMIMTKTSATSVVVTPTPPASGTISNAYKASKNLIQDLKRTTEVISIDGYIVNDYIHESALSTKYYAEEKAAMLMKIIGDTVGSADMANLALRNDALYTGRYMAFQSSGVKGKVKCKKCVVTDETPTSEPTYVSSSTQRVSKMKVSLQFMMGVPK
jgi:hypothetical protein